MRPSSRIQRSFEEEQIAFGPEKERIGKAASNLIRNGETVLLDGGTTTMQIAKALVRRDDVRDIVVFTNGLNIALELERAIPRLSVVVTGGTLRPLQHALVEPLGAPVLDHVNVDVAFISCDGVHAARGVTTAGLAEVTIKQRMMQAAARTVVVADGSKIGQVGLVQVCSLDRVDVVVTDGSADPESVASLSAAGAHVEIVNVDGARLEEHDRDEDATARA